MKNNVTALKAHISLNVMNVSKSVEFYQKLFGVEPSKIRQGYAKFDVHNPPLNLALSENSHIDRRRGALSHLGIQVASTEDVLETKKRWEEAGLSAKDEMQTNCCYALQDKTWASDPDGNEWEVFVVLEDNLQETAMCCVGAESEIVAEQKPENSVAGGCVSEATPISKSRTIEQSCC